MCMPAGTQAAQQLHEAECAVDLGWCSKPASRLWGAVSPLDLDPWKYHSSGASVDLHARACRSLWLLRNRVGLKAPAIQKGSGNTYERERVLGMHAIHRLIPHSQNLESIRFKRELSALQEISMARDVQKKHAVASCAAYAAVGYSGTKATVPLHKKVLVA